MTDAPHPARSLRPPLLPWVPVLLAAGIGVYFWLKAEPSPMLLAVLWAALGISGLAILAGYRRAAGAVFFLAAGFLLAALRTQSLEAPRWDGDDRPRMVHGKVERIEPLASGSRLTLRDVDIWRWPPERTPPRVRVKVYELPEGIEVGRRVAVKASLTPPARAGYPGGYDFARWAYFQGIGAAGYAVRPPRCLDCAEEPQGGFAAAMERLRHHMHARILATAGPGAAAEGAISSALLTGLRGEIPKPELEALRISGLGHLLSISGLHMVMVTMTVFYALRRLLALWPAAALRVNTKKLAALLALAAAFFYLLIAGAPVPAFRAFVMIALFFVAVLIDRVSLTLRPLAWAAIAVLLLSPEALLGPSFQMSFAATFALIVVMRRVTDAGLLKAESAPRRVGRYFLSLLLASVAAGAATLPFALYHFGRVAMYSVLANLLALPIANIVVMPAGIAALVLMPLSLEALPLAVMRWGLSALLWVAETCARLPQADLSLPQPPVAALLAMVAGALLYALCLPAWRRAGLVLLAAGTVWMFVPPRGPDLIVHEGGKLFAVRDAKGGYRFSLLRPARVARNEWMETLGLKQAEKIDAPGADLAPWRCDAALCRWGEHVALYRQEGPCIEAAVAVTLAGECRGAELTLTPEALTREGTHALWLETGGPRIRTVTEAGGKRLWTGGPKPNKNRGDD